MSSEDSYRLLLYQTWAAASAAGKTNSASAASNPAAAAAAAAWSSHYAQAIKVNYAGYCIIDREPSTVFKNHSKCLISSFFAFLLNFCPLKMEKLFSLLAILNETFPVIFKHRGASV